MTAYAPLLELQIQHEYFVGAKCESVHFEADESTNKFMRDVGLILKHRQDGLTIYYGQAKPNEDTPLMMALSDAASPPKLWFRMRLKDSKFLNVTNPSILQRNSVMFFTNQNTSSNFTQSAQSLSKKHTVSNQDFIRLDASELADVLRVSERRVPPLAFVCISLRNVDLLVKDEPLMMFILRFETVRSHWKYYLLGDLANDFGIIVDKTKQKVRDEPPVEFSRRAENLSDNRSTISFTSNEKIALREHSNNHFKLEDKRTGKTVIDHLPVASPIGLSKDMIGGKDVLISEIYVNL